MNFLLDFKKQEQYLRADISRFGKVDTYKRVWDDFGGLNEDSLPTLSYNNVEILFLGNNTMKVITWPKIVSSSHTPPDKIEFIDVSNYLLVIELHETLCSVFVAKSCTIHTQNK